MDFDLDDSFIFLLGLQPPEQIIKLYVKKIVSQITSQKSGS